MLIQHSGHPDLRILHINLIHPARPVRLHYLVRNHQMLFLLREIDLKILRRGSTSALGPYGFTEQAIRQALTSLCTNEYIWARSDELKAFKCINLLTKRAPRAALLTIDIFLRLIRYFGCDLYAIIFESLFLCLEKERKLLRDTLFNINHALYQSSIAFGLQDIVQSASLSLINSQEHGNPAISEESTDSASSHSNLVTNPLHNFSRSILAKTSGNTSYPPSWSTAKINSDLFAQNSPILDFPHAARISDVFSNPVDGTQTYKCSLDFDNLTPSDLILHHPPTFTATHQNVPSPCSVDPQPEPLSPTPGQIVLAGIQDIQPLVCPLQIPIKDLLPLSSILIPHPTDSTTPQSQRLTNPQQLPQSQPQTSPTPPLPGTLIAAYFPFILQMLSGDVANMKILATQTYHNQDHVQINPTTGIPWLLSDSNDSSSDDDQTPKSTSPSKNGMPANANQIQPIGPAPNPALFFNQTTISILTQQSPPSTTPPRGLSKLTRKSTNHDNSPPNGNGPSNPFFNPHHHSEALHFVFSNTTPVEFYRGNAMNQFKSKLHDEITHPTPLNTLLTRFGFKSGPCSIMPIPTTHHPLKYLPQLPLQHIPGFPTSRYLYKSMSTLLSPLNFVPRSDSAVRSQVFYLGYPRYLLNSDIFDPTLIQDIIPDEPDQLAIEEERLAQARLHELTNVDTGKRQLRRARGGGEINHVSTVLPSDSATAAPPVQFDDEFDSNSYEAEFASMILGVISGMAKLPGYHELTSISQQIFCPDKCIHECFPHPMINNRTADRLDPIALWRSKERQLHPESEANEGSSSSSSSPSCPNVSNNYSHNGKNDDLTRNAAEQQVEQYSEPIVCALGINSFNNEMRLNSDHSFDITYVQSREQSVQTNASDSAIIASRLKSTSSVYPLSPDPTLTQQHSSPTPISPALAFNQTHPDSHKNSLSRAKPPPDPITTGRYDLTPLLPPEDQRKPVHNTVLKYACVCPCHHLLTSEYQDDPRPVFTQDSQPTSTNPGVIPMQILLQTTITYFIFRLLVSGMHIGSSPEFLSCADLIKNGEISEYANGHGKDSLLPTLIQVSPPALAPITPGPSSGNPPVLQHLTNFGPVHPLQIFLGSVRYLLTTLTQPVSYTDSVISFTPEMLGQLYGLERLTLPSSKDKSSKTKLASAATSEPAIEQSQSDGIGTDCVPDLLVCVDASDVANHNSFGYFQYECNPYMYDDIVEDFPELTDELRFANNLPSSSLPVPPFKLQKQNRADKHRDSINLGAEQGGKVVNTTMVLEMTDNAHSPAIAISETPTDDNPPSTSSMGSSEVPSAIVEAPQQQQSELTRRPPKPPLYYRTAQFSQVTYQSNLVASRLKELHNNGLNPILPNPAMIDMDEVEVQTDDGSKNDKSEIDDQNSQSRYFPNKYTIATVPRTPSPTSSHLSTSVMNKTFKINLHQKPYRDPAFPFYLTPTTFALFHAFQHQLTLLPDHTLLLLYQQAGLTSIYYPGVDGGNLPSVLLSARVNKPINYDMPDAPQRPPGGKKGRGKKKSKLTLPPLPAKIAKAERLASAAASAAHSATRAARAKRAANKDSEVYSSDTPTVSSASTSRRRSATSAIDSDEEYAPKPPRSRPGKRGGNTTAASQQTVENQADHQTVAAAAPQGPFVPMGNNAVYPAQFVQNHGYINHNFSGHQFHTTNLNNTSAGLSDGDFAQLLQQQQQQQHQNMTTNTLNVNMVGMNGPTLTSSQNQFNLIGQPRLGQSMQLGQTQQQQQQQQQMLYAGFSSGVVPVMTPMGVQYMPLSQVQQQMQMQSQLPQQFSMSYQQPQQLPSNNSSLQNTLASNNVSLQTSLAGSNANSINSSSLPNSSQSSKLPGLVATSMNAHGSITTLTTTSSGSPTTLNQTGNVPINALHLSALNPVDPTSPPSGKLNPRPIDRLFDDAEANVKRQRTSATGTATSTPLAMQPMNLQSTLLPQQLLPKQHASALTSTTTQPTLNANSLVQLQQNPLLPMTPVQPHSLSHIATMQLPGATALGFIFNPKNSSAPHNSSASSNPSITTTAAVATTNPATSALLMNSTRPLGAAPSSILANTISTNGPFPTGLGSTNSLPATLAAAVNPPFQQPGLQFPSQLQQPGSQTFSQQTFSFIPHSQSLPQQFQPQLTPQLGQLITPNNQLHSQHQQLPPQQRFQHLLAQSSVLKK